MAATMAWSVRAAAWWLSLLLRAGTDAFTDKQVTSNAPGADGIHELPLSLSLEEIFKGKTLNANVERASSCPHCGGKGYTVGVGGAQWPCEVCGGTGNTKRNVAVAVTIPPGSPDGGAAVVGIGPGEYIRIRISSVPHTLYTRAGGAGEHLEHVVKLRGAGAEAEAEGGGFTRRLALLDGSTLLLILVGGGPVPRDDLVVLPGLGMPLATSRREGSGELQLRFAAADAGAEAAMMTGTPASGAAKAGYRGSRQGLQLRQLGASHAQMGAQPPLHHGGSTAEPNSALDADFGQSGGVLVFPSHCFEAMPSAGDGDGNGDGDGDGTSLTLLHWEVRLGAAAGVGWAGEEAQPGQQPGQLLVGGESTLAEGSASAAPEGSELGQSVRKEGTGLRLLLLRPSSSTHGAGSAPSMDDGAAGGAPPDKWASYSVVGQSPMVGYSPPLDGGGPLELQAMVLDSTAAHAMRARTGDCLGLQAEPGGAAAPGWLPFSAGSAASSEQEPAGHGAWACGATQLQSPVVRELDLSECREHRGRQYLLRVTYGGAAAASAGDDDTAPPPPPPPTRDGSTDDQSGSTRSSHHDVCALEAHPELLLVDCTRGWMDRTGHRVLSAAEAGRIAGDNLLRSTFQLPQSMLLTASPTLVEYSFSLAAGTVASNTTVQGWTAYCPVCLQTDPQAPAQFEARLNAALGHPAALHAGMRWRSALRVTLPACPEPLIFYGPGVQIT
jgi:hypothetical protein